MPELVGHGSAGVMIPPSDSQALAGAIRDLYNDPSRARTIGLLGQQRIKDVFNIDTTIQKTHQILSELTTTAS
jgi:rhamnosyl/mannosyltransferase